MAKLQPGHLEVLAGEQWGWHKLCSDLASHHCLRSTGAAVFQWEGIGNSPWHFGGVCSRSEA